jgi:hypothetical protein
VIIEEDEYLAHYGILRKSGRYPWGSGETEHIRNKTFLQMVDSLRAQGLSESDVCTAFGIGTTDSSGKFRPSTTQLRAAKTIAKNEQKQAQIGEAQRLKDKGYSNVAAAAKMGIPESSYRALLVPGAKEKADALVSTSEMLKRQVDEKKFLDVGAGVENYVGVSKERLGTAVALLKEQGYEVHRVKIRQIGTGKETEMKILAPPGTTWGDVQRNRSEIKQIREFSDDNGHSFGRVQEPISVNPKRVHVLYDEDGGSKADGVIYVRPGVPDVSLGNSRYAQVRVKVGEDHYLKGMAIYKDDLPKGVDLQFNTNKKSTGNKLDAMKKMTDDPDLPFGAVVRQIVGKDGKVTSAMNIVNEEGKWSDWSRTLSTQMLSKQSPRLAKEQLDTTYDRRKKELDEIKALTNPTVRKKLLESYADGTDSAAVHLKAAALPRQASQVILPINSMKPSEVYAPNYKNGERVVLIRYPHGGTFEIPELTVNNRNAEARKILGDAKDAIGIHHKVAERLSGADFDGDSVLVIPNNSNRVKTSPALEQLKNFDPKREYPKYEGMKVMDARTKGQEMGKVSNLITDMTIRGAPHSDIARAVRHSMVVIDAEKHELNYKQSAIDNGIRQLSEKYQGRASGGASTLISRATSEVRVPDRKDRPMSEGGPIDPVTGRRVYVETGKLNQVGKPRLIKSEKLAETDDAHTLSSGTPIEKLYADHSNRLKALANDARLEYLNTPPLKYSPTAKVAYSEQVDSLNAKLALAQRNAPRERQAQVVANAMIRAKLDANPNLEGDSLKKVKYQALEEARSRMGAKKNAVEITPAEWDAIQAGAISNSKLKDILDNADLDQIKSLAQPRSTTVMPPSAISRAKSMLASGYTRAEVSEQLGVSLSTLSEVLS